MNTLTDILTHYRVDFQTGGTHHHVSTGWVGVDCPRCSPGEQRYRLGINLVRLYATCWSCGAAKLGDTLVALTGEAWPVIKEMLRSLGRPHAEPLSSPAGILKLPKGRRPLLTAHRDYLRSRDFDPDELAKLWGLKGIGLAAKLAWRLFVPITHQGRTVSWTTRSLTDHGRRYVSAAASEEAVPAKTLLYGGDYVRHAAVVVEGPADAWRIGPGAVATLGIGYSRAQLLRLSRIPVRAICFDSEPEAMRRADKLVADLNVFPGQTFMVRLNAADPGSASAREVRKIRQAFLE